MQNTWITPTVTVSSVVGQLDVIGGRHSHPHLTDGNPAGGRPSGL